MSTKNISITILLPAGRLPLDIMAKAHDLAQRFDLGLYCSLAQNLRLINVPEEAAATVKAELAELGAEFKGPGKFPLPRICIGKNHCPLGIVDTEAMSDKILSHFKDRKETKAKFKIAISGCPLNCSAPKETDIGVIATRKGYEIYAGGKSGPFPKVGRRIKRGASPEEVVEIINSLVDFHHEKTATKQRMAKLLKEPDFPFDEV